MFFVFKGSTFFRDYSSNSRITMQFDVPFCNQSSKHRKIKALSVLMAVAASNSIGV